MKRIFLLIAIITSATANAQFVREAADTSWKKIFRGSHPKENNLVHTKLDVKFDYSKSWLLGKEWLTLQPHYYPTDSVWLDAKGMDLKEVSLMKGNQKVPLTYKYDGMEIRITLDKTYTKNEKYTLYFDYISKPDELKVEGSAAITDAKGLYFINPKGEDKEKPTQIWTQGETESNSAWMITIDKPNQKTTQEITMTVPEKYVTLSNGLLLSQKKNNDGTRSDYWKMDLPHAPYLFFMGVGEYEIIKDTYKGKQVNYYVEKAYAPYAKAIFGNTPEMMSYFSKILGVDFPWQKYSQIVGRDYVSGAMENTTATLHQESAYQNNRELADGNAWEETIAHELFHQWFGDYVTTESWSNITVNESFANYSEYLWDEYKHSKDFADEHNYQDMQGYLMSMSENKDLVRYRYSNKEDVFDGVSYNKGGRILHMLRNYVGDSAFFQALNNYLVTNKFKCGEAANLRLSFEEITGQDMNWFWNQWYYGSGHPKLKIDYLYDDAAKKAIVIVEQTQKSGKIFQLPVSVDVYNGPAKDRYSVWLKNKIDTLYFPYKNNVKPELINVDADKILLAEKTDNKSEENMIAQWKYAKNYLDRREAIEYFAKKTMPEIAKGLTDKYGGIKRLTMQKLATTPYKNDANVLALIEDIAKRDFDKKTKAAAIKYLVKTGDKKYEPIFKANTGDSSYSVAGAALEGLVSLDKNNAYSIAKQYSNDAKGALGDIVNDILLNNGTAADAEIIIKAYKNNPPSEKKLSSTDKFITYLTKVEDINLIKQGIDHVISFRNMIPAQYRAFIDETFNKSFDKLSKAKGAEIENYIKERMK